MSRWKENPMKGKIAVFVSIAALAMFIAAPMASASGYDFWWRMLIRGEYVFTGSGACTLAPTGFKENFTPKDPGLAWMGPNFWAGVYTFNSNNTGKMEAHQVYHDGPPFYGAGAANLSWEFTYEMDGPEITFTLIPHTYSLEYTLGPNTRVLPKVVPPSLAYFDKPWTGRISPDGRTLFVFYGVPMKLVIPELGGIEAVCQAVHQGFKTH
jgi:hypothetical protein